MTTNRVLRGVPEGGQFAATKHAEPDVTLAPAPTYDAEAVAKGILRDVRDYNTSRDNEMYYATYEAIRAGKTSYQGFLDGLIAKNHGGRCEQHEHDADHSPERYCRDCRIAFMVEARTNPKPLPSPRGVVPVRQAHHHLTREQLSREYDPATKTENTTTKVTGDEKFEAAIRRLFDAPDDAPVEIIQEDCEYGTDWTRETDSEITVKCGDREATYSYLGALMQDLDRKDRNPEAMALRFMRAVDGERPLLNGIAAVYLDRGEHRDPEPVFGKIRDVFSGRDASMDFLYLDGRQDYIHFNQVAAILETDQSSEYNETD